MVKRFKRKLKEPTPSNTKYLTPSNTKVKKEEGNHFGKSNLGSYKIDYKVKDTVEFRGSHRILSGIKGSGLWSKRMGL